MQSRLAPVVTLVDSWGVADSRSPTGSTRPREHARRRPPLLADALVARDGTLSRQDVEDTLETATGNGQLYEWVSTDDRTQAVVRFAPVYERSASLFGPRLGATQPARSFFTTAATRPPSAWPATFGFTIFMTAPMARGPSAPAAFASPTA